MNSTPEILRRDENLEDVTKPGELKEFFSAQSVETFGLRCAWMRCPEKP
jgi:hypothetical protein